MITLGALILFWLDLRARFVSRAEWDTRCNTIHGVPVRPAERKSKVKNLFLRMVGLFNLALVACVFGLNLLLSGPAAASYLSQTYDDNPKTVILLGSGLLLGLLNVIARLTPTDKDDNFLNALKGLTDQALPGIVQRIPDRKKK